MSAQYVGKKKSFKFYNLYTVLAIFALSITLKNKMRQDFKLYPAFEL